MNFFSEAFGNATRLITAISSCREDHLARAFSWRRIGFRVVHSLHPQVLVLWVLVVDGTRRGGTSLLGRRLLVLAVFALGASG